MQLGLTNIFRIWFQYLLIGAAALLTSAFALIAISKGFSETSAIIGAAIVTVVLAFSAWQLVIQGVLKRHPNWTLSLACILGFVLAEILLYFYDASWVIPSLVYLYLGVIGVIVIMLGYLFVFDFMLTGIKDSFRKPIT